MKLSKLSAVFIFSLLFSLLVQAQEVIPSVAAALKSGNAAQIAKNFDKRVDITIDDNADNYSNTQAEMILKGFLGKFSFRDFTVIHKGTSPDGAQYTIGSLKTNAGSYRTYIYVKKSGGVQFIQEIRFEKE
ncbi:MAG TPA: DUF4783 domain-containing protein [Chitinophagales bacterium]|jgi:hypothetical protein|nr:DUF4783 domain-containing protein [Chitinophagales bacterium]HPA35192.1 DUF4783 domain-containing protein [Chitinophagales bacterium]HQO31892.1 DUF4783 domain-containing protein [Chitinophagales bacterium]HQO89019.1 DUF4783 domain-containing protein [Chitinophagales bacterium]